MKTIVIKTWRGLIDEVYSDDKDVEVIIINDDDEGTPSVNLPPYKNY